VELQLFTNEPVVGWFSAEAVAIIDKDGLDLSTPGDCE
jgi:hypothetical protein